MYDEEDLRGYIAFYKQVKSEMKDSVNDPFLRAVLLGAISHARRAALDEFINRRAFKRTYAADLKLALRRD